jgi:TfoX/Sxy family transcriptional regulator of competence genes
MSYNEKLADRVRELLLVHTNNIEEKAMFGGLCFMVNDKMCMGVIQESLMIRFNPEYTEIVMEIEGYRPMDFTGRPMKGYAFVDTDALNTNKKLEYWIKLSLEYNKIAKSSKKKTTKKK